MIETKSDQDNIFRYLKRGWFKVENSEVTSNNFSIINFSCGSIWQFLIGILWTYGLMHENWGEWRCDFESSIFKIDKNSWDIMGLPLWFFLKEILWEIFEIICLYSQFLTFSSGIVNRMNKKKFGLSRHYVGLRKVCETKKNCKLTEWQKEKCSEDVGRKDKIKKKGKEEVLSKKERNKGEKKRRTEKNFEGKEKRGKKKRWKIFGEQNPSAKKSDRPFRKN